MESNIIILQWICTELLCKNGNTMSCFFKKEYIDNYFSNDNDCNDYF